MIRKLFLPGWLAALLGGLIYLLLHSAIEISFPDYWAGSPDRLLGISYAGWSRLIWIPAAFLMVGFTGLYQHTQSTLGKLGKFAYWLTIIGFGLDILGNFIEFWMFGVFLVPFLGEFRTGSAGSNFGYEISLYGSISLMAGLVLFGLACLRATALTTRWRVLPVMMGLVYLSAFYFYFVELMAVHAVLFGACWMAVGYFLKQEA